MPIFLKNIPAKFHADPIWNDGDNIDTLKRSPNKNNKMINDVRSILDLTILHFAVPERQQLKICSYVEKFKMKI